MTLLRKMCFLGSMIRRIIIITLVLFTTGAAYAASSEPAIRVAVASEPATITVEARGGGLLTVTDAALRPITKAGVATIVASSYGLRVNGKPQGGAEVVIRSREIRIDGRTFRDSVRIVRNANGIIAVNDLPLETYLVGLISSEISPDWPPEAIKAQAVAARTYAINQMDRVRRARPDASYDLESTMLDQVYDGAHREEAHVFGIVEATRGQVLRRNGVSYPVFYHSCCGGLTEYAHNVWNDAEGPPIVEDRYCKRSPKHDWSYRISKAEFQKILSENKMLVGAVSSVTTVPLFDSPRVDTVVVEGAAGIQNVKATELRKILGYANLKSTWFQIAISGKDIVFTGRGYGHGVGMCQWGAKGMAEEGHAYSDILKFYYPDAELTTIY